MEAVGKAIAPGIRLLSVALRVVSTRTKAQTKGGTGRPVKEDERLKKILKKHRFVRLEKHYRGIRPPELRDADTGQVLLRTWSDDLITRKIEAKGWHPVWDWRGLLRVEPLNAHLKQLGWRPLSTVPERKPIEVWIESYLSTDEAYIPEHHPHGSALVVIHGHLFVIETMLDVAMLKDLNSKKW